MSTIKSLFYALGTVLFSVVGLTILRGWPNFYSLMSCTIIMFVVAFIVIKFTSGGIKI